MNLTELEHRFRTDTGDWAKPPLFSQVNVRRWLNEAEEEAARRADLLQESDDPAFTQIAVAAGDTTWSAHARWCRITRAVWVPTGCEEIPLRLVFDRRELDLTASRSWRTTPGTPRELLIEGGKKMRFGCIPETGGTLFLEGFRLPLGPMTDGEDRPEIEPQHHRHLVLWAMATAYRIPDADMHDPGRADSAEAEFAAYFGPRRDAQLGQDTEAPAFVRAWP